MTDIIQDRHVVDIHYTLTDDDGQILDTSGGGGEPLSYLHGAQNLVPGLERRLTGRKIGDQFSVSVAPEEGYGARDDAQLDSIPRTDLPEGMAPQVGMELAAEMPDGTVFPIWIKAVDEENIHVDANHPLAGQTLHFEIEVVSVRAATEVEMEHGHPHHPDGHGCH